MIHFLFRFEFLGEPALDAGGVAREFFSVICNQIFNPDCGLFLYSAVNQMCMQINPNSGIANEHHLRYLLLFLVILCISIVYVFLVLLLYRQTTDFFQRKKSNCFNAICTLSFCWCNISSRLPSFTSFTESKLFLHLHFFFFLIPPPHRYFHMAGRILGKALMDGQITPVHLIQPLYKHLMGWPVTFKVLDLIVSFVCLCIER